MLQAQPERPNSSPKSRYESNETGILVYKNNLSSLEKNLEKKKGELKKLKEEHENKNVVGKVISKVKESLSDTEYEKKVRSLNNDIKKQQDDINQIKNNIAKLKDVQKALLKENPKLAFAMFDEMFKPKIEGKFCDVLRYSSIRLSFVEKNGNRIIEVYNMKKALKTSFIKKGEYFYVSDGNEPSLVSDDNLYDFISKLESMIKPAIAEEKSRINREKAEKDAKVRATINLAENSTHNQEESDAEKMMDDYLLMG